MTILVNDSYFWRCASIKILVLWQQGKCYCLNYCIALLHEFSIPVLFHIYYVYSWGERRKCFVSPIFICRMEQFQVSRWRRMKTPEEGTGATKLSLCSPAWATLWVWVTFGGFPTSATEMEEVHTHFQQICLSFVVLFLLTPICTHTGFEREVYSLRHHTGPVYHLWSVLESVLLLFRFVTSHLPDDAAIDGQIMALAGCIELQSKPSFLNHAKFCVTVLLLAGVWMPSYQLWVHRMRPAAASPDVWLWVHSCCIRTYMTYIPPPLMSADFIFFVLCVVLTYSCMLQYS